MAGDPRAASLPPTRHDRSWLLRRPPRVPVRALLSARDHDPLQKGEKRISAPPTRVQTLAEQPLHPLDKGVCVQVHQRGPEGHRRVVAEEGPRFGPEMRRVTDGVEGVQ